MPKSTVSSKNSVTSFLLIVMTAAAFSAVTAETSSGDASASKPVKTLKSAPPKSHKNEMLAPGGAIPATVKEKAESLGFTAAVFETENRTTDLVVYKVHQDVRSPKQMPIVYIWFHPASQRVAIEY
jgi:hypothetical protein